MKISILLCLLLAMPTAYADELADANALYQQKNYAQALPLYTKLGNAGNVEAQQHLGEMYWHGQGGVADAAQARAWFSKAAAKGNKPAQAALALMQRRAAHEGEIALWVSQYDGSELKEGKYRCAAPRLPSVSKDNASIKAVSDKVDEWQDCYNAYVTHLNASIPLNKKIPPAIAAMMTAEEAAQAEHHLGAIETNLTEEAKITRKMVLADVAAWRSATEAWVTEHNAIVNNGPSKERQDEMDARKRNYAPAR